MKNPLLRTKSKLTLPFPLRENLTLGSWFKIRYSNLFIIPFAILVLVVYAALTQGLNTGNLLGSALVGLPVGYLIALVETHSRDLQRVCNRRPFSSFLLLKTIRLSLMFCLLFAFLIPVFVLLDIQFGYTIFSIGLEDFLTQRFAELLLISLAVAGVTNFFLEINRKLGPGVLINLITGRYHRPESQERTFLFLDLKNSTTLAEEMGDLTFSRFLQDFFYDISDTISRYRGEVYQYVGDEVVISWKEKRGVKSNLALDCLLAIQDRIQLIASYYVANYGHLPEFKAGIHRGQVVIAEVGKLKSEIAYHGDVLNTTSRIVDLCRTLEHDLLISASVNDMLATTHGLSVSPMGSFFLKGKSRGVTLFAVEKDLGKSVSAETTGNKPATKQRQASTLQDQTENHSEIAISRQIA